MAPPVRAVSLDAMGTLMELARPPHIVYHEILRRQGHSVEKLSPLLSGGDRLRRYWLEAERRLPPEFLAEHRDRFHHYRGAPRAFWGVMFTVLFEDLGLDPDRMPAALEAAYQRFAQPDLWIVEPTFASLARYCAERRIELYVTSNWDFRLPGILQALKIAATFRKIITSAEVGYEKPSRKIFDHLVDVAGFAPSEIIHVGDTPAADVEGARRAGLIPVLYRRTGPSPCRNVPRVRALQEVRLIATRLPGP